MVLVGVISGVQKHIQRVKDEILSQFDFVCVDEKDVVSVVGIGRLVNGDKRPLLDSLQCTYGNVIISGDALWSETLCQYLLGNLGGSLLIDITLPKSDELPQGQYWRYEGIMDWVVQVQSKRVPLHQFKRVTPNDGAIVYLDTDNSQFQSNMVALMEVIQNHYEKRDVLDVSMEDVIKRAMADLGIEPPPAQEVSKDVPEKVIPEPVIKETPELVEEHPVETVSESIPTIGSINEKSPEENQIPDTSSTINNSTVYLKMREGTMVLFIPAGTQLPTQIIDGGEYQTMVFTAPDLGNTGLQPLKIQNAVGHLVKRQPISTHTSSVDTSELQQLLTQKTHLDQSIKEARAANDEARVIELRRQRRLIRRQINKWGIEACYDVKLE